MAFTKINAAGIGTTETVTVDGLTVINDGSFGGNLTVGGVLTYEDVTNVDSVGLITARNGIVVGSGITLSKDGDIFATGITTVSGNVKVGTGITLSPDGDVFFTGIATGNGSGLTALNASNIASGTVPTARLGSGTASSSTFLRGDSTFQTVNTDLVSDTSPQLGGNLDTNDKNIVFADSDSGSGTDNRAVFGASSDLQIYHDGGGSKITHANTGDLIINNTSGDTWLGTNGVLRVSNASNNGYMAKFVENGTAELYHDGTKKFETISTGVLITGSDDGDGGAKGDFKFLNTSGTLKMMFDASTAQFEFLDNSSATFGSGDDLIIKHNGTHSFIDNNTGDLYIQTTGSGDDILIESADNISLKVHGSEDGINITGDGSVQLYHDNVERLTTTTQGADVYIAGDSGLRIRGNAADVDPRIVFRRKNNDGGNAEPAAIQMTYVAGTTYESGHLDFFTNGDSGSAALANRMRIRNDGVIMISQTSTDTPGTGNNTAGFAFKSMRFYGSGTNHAPLAMNRSNDGIVALWYRGGNLVGNVTVGGGGVAYNTTSDYRLKENVTAISDGITRLKTLKPSRFNFISEPGKTVDGFLAHEVTAVPEAITGTKDQIANADDVEEGTAKAVGDPVYQEIDQSKLVPLLAAALQEAIAKIETLETKVAALEG